MGEPNATFNPPPLRVALGGEAIARGDIARDELATAVATSPLLEVADDTEGADLRVDAQPESVFRYYRRGESVALAAFRIPVKRLRSLPRKVMRIAEQIAAYRNLDRLEASTSYLADLVEFQFARLTRAATRSSTREPEAEPLPRNDAGEWVLQSGQNLAIAVTHRAPAPLYVYIVSMDSRLQSVGLVYPYKTEFSARIRPDDRALVVGAGPEYLLELQAPAGYPDGLDRFKVFVSTAAIEPGVLMLPNLGTRSEVSTDPYGSGSRLDRDLRRVVLGLTGTTAMPSFADQPWWSTTYDIRVVNP